VIISIGGSKSSKIESSGSGRVLTKGHDAMISVSIRLLVATSKQLRSKILESAGSFLAQYAHVTPEQTLHLVRCVSQ
jgi:hypothetical protein